MGVESDGVVEGLEHAVADAEPLATAQVDAVLFALDYEIVDEQILEGAHVDAKLRAFQVKAAKPLDAQIFDVEEGDLSAQPVNFRENLIDAVDDNLQALDGNVFIVGFGQGPFVQQHMSERAFFVRFFQENIVAELKTGITTQVYRARHFVRSGLTDYDRTALIDCFLEGNGIVNSTGFGTKTKGRGIGKTDILGKELVTKKREDKKTDC